MKLPKLGDIAEERLLEFVKILTEAIDYGSKHPQLITSCLAKRAMHYLLLGRFTESLKDLGNLLAVSGTCPLFMFHHAIETMIVVAYALLPRRAQAGRC